MTSIDEEPRITYRDMRSNLEVIADERIKERVLKGIELLEKEWGPDWVDHIDPRSLTLSSSSSCVLGQLYGEEAREHGDSNGYYYGRHKLHIGGSEYGFDVVRESYLKLTNVWRAAFGLPPLDREPTR